jgi:alkylation response protein AidB-like acyl-CoA dehydrogenase
MTRPNAETLPPTTASTASRALAAAGDAQSARDVAALDDAAEGAKRRLQARRRSLVERLIYGPPPPPEELIAGGRLSEAGPGPAAQAALSAALECLGRGQAFTANGKLSAELRSALAREKAYGFTVPAPYGGAGSSYTELALLEEELAANGLGALAVEISGQLTIGAGSLLAYGTGAQKSLFLPMLSEGRLMAFGLTEVGVGVNAKKVGAYVEWDEAAGCWRLFASGDRAKLYITNATHGALVGLVARLGLGGKQVGLFVLELPEGDVQRGQPLPDGSLADFDFECRSTGVSAFQANHNSRLSFDNFPIQKHNQIEADGVEVLFYCLRLGRCMLAAMSAGYQRMLAADALHFARQRDGVGGRVVRHELPRLNLGKVLGGALQARALSHLSLDQDAAGADLAGLRDLTKSAAAGTALESLHATEHVLGGRTFHLGQRSSEARANLHVFGVVEGEDDLILMGMVKDLTAGFTGRYLAGLLGVIEGLNRGPDGQPVPAEQRILRIDPATFLRAPGKCLRASLALFGLASFWALVGWILANGLRQLARLPLALVPAALLPRYRSLPGALRAPARRAEERLARLRWSYLFVNLWFQLELTRAQIPLQRLGKAIEHLTSIVTLCWHACGKDAEVQRLAALQVHLLEGKLAGLRIATGLFEMERLRRLVAAVGADLEGPRPPLLIGLEPEPFAQPWKGASPRR